MTNYTLGVDIGTTGICAVALDPESRQTLYTAHCPNDAFIVTDRDWEKIQDPQKILSAVKKLIDEVLTALNRLPAAVGVTGQMHGILYLNAEGKPISPLYTWQDGRGTQKLDDGKSVVETALELTGQKVYAGYGLVTHIYNLKQGLVPADAACLCTVHDWIAMWLAGRKSPVMHASDAASLGFYDTARHVFDTDALQKLGVDADILPRVTAESEVLGYYAETAPVRVAIGDNQASFLGAVGQRGEDVLLINVGTGSQVSIVGSRTESKNGIECRPLADGKFLLVGSSLCGGRAYALLEKLFCEIANLCGAQIASAYPFMDRAMEQIGDRTTELTVSTLFDGTREDPSLRGSITGISVENLHAVDLMRGFLQGIADELHRFYTQMRESGVCAEARMMIGAGNGLRYNPTLCRAIEHVFGLPLELSTVSEEAAVGAAGFAAEI